MPTYQLYSWVFDGEAFGVLIGHAREQIGFEVLAEMIGVKAHTLDKWEKRQYDDKFPYPMITNILAVCNLLDADPRQFFILEEK